MIRDPFGSESDSNPGTMGDLSTHRVNLGDGMWKGHFGQVPDLILVQARVLARSASRPRGLRVYSVVIAASVG